MIDGCRLAQLLWCHVVRRADRGARAGQVAACGVEPQHDVLDLGDPEVQKLHEVCLAATSGQEDVVGFDVPVDDAALVGKSQGLAALRRDTDGALHVEWALLVDHLAQIAAFEQLHHNVGQPVGQVPHVHDFHDVFIAEHGRGSGLAIEAHGDLSAMRDVGMQRLQRALPPEQQVLGHVDAAHTTLAELAQHTVATVDHRSNQIVSPRTRRHRPPLDPTSADLMCQAPGRQHPAAVLAALGDPCRWPTPSAPLPTGKDRLSVIHWLRGGWPRVLQR